MEILEKIIKLLTGYSPIISILIAILVAHLLNLALKWIRKCFRIQDERSRLIEILEMLACIILGALVVHSWMHKFLYPNLSQHSNDRYFLTGVFICVTFFSIIIYICYDLVSEYLRSR